MKYAFLYCLFGLLVLSACNNPKNSANTTETTADSTANVKAELTESFYKRFEGTIAGKKVIMHLQKVDDDVSGTYYYDGSWLNLSTDTLIGKDSIILTEYSFYESYFTRDFKSPHLALKWNGNGFNGN